MFCWETSTLTLLLATARGGGGGGGGGGGVITLENSVFMWTFVDEEEDWGSSVGLCACLKVLGFVVDFAGFGSLNLVLDLKIVAEL